MCVVSMVMDHYTDKWPRIYGPGIIPLTPSDPAKTPPPEEEARKVTELLNPKPQITQAEVDEFRRLLERAREYDRKNNEPECELAEKKEALKAIAKQLGVDISFVDENPTELR